MRLPRVPVPPQHQHGVAGRAHWPPPRSVSVAPMRRQTRHVVGVVDQQLGEVQSRRRRRAAIDPGQAFERHRHPERRQRRLPSGMDDGPPRAPRRAVGRGPVDGDQDLGRHRPAARAAGTLADGDVEADVGRVGRGREAHDVERRVGEGVELDPVDRAHLWFRARRRYARRTARRSASGPRVPTFVSRSRSIAAAGPPMSCSSRTGSDLDRIDPREVGGQVERGQHGGAGEPLAAEQHGRRRAAGE